MTIRAAADGSALGNPGPAGWAWYVDDSCWAAGGWKHATNNQAELTAVLQFLRATSHLDDDLLILCDSQYVINCVTKWMPGWKRKGWRKADGKPVMNVELLQEIDAELPGRRYRFEWVKGHANHPLNEAADSRARAVSEAYQRGAAIPSGPGFVRAGESAVARPSDTLLAAAPEEPPPAVLFDLDEPVPAETVDVVVTLSAAEFERLSARARTRGVRPDQVLRDLI
ncbi:ribonuclease HI [Glaciihabitans sp. INWT7]|uniref:RNase H family protein n=1 Tax=Glaciihabitans sp. INWT7 TaxID=2596912 RepID=UPI00162903DA|nr:RNase H family protein [Glaciihabitans sp. INWT7]QNE46507.1 ribonuclease HI [Glaciihabitans sp. INWT7]